MTALNEARARLHRAACFHRGSAPYDLGFDSTSLSQLALEQAARDFVAAETKAHARYCGCGRLLDANGICPVGKTSGGM